MPDFVPVNPLESLLRKLLSGEDGRVWQFLTPMAAAPLFLITKHYPELDGSDLVAPPGQNPAYPLWTAPNGQRHLGIYTSDTRVREAFAALKLSRADFTWVSLQGYKLLKWLWADHGAADDVHFFVNLFAENAWWHIDPDFIEIILERPAPPPLPDEPPTQFANVRPPGNPAASLGPLHDFLAKSPNARAAFILATPAPGHYDLALVMADPEDRSLEQPVTLILKAVTPVDEEWQVGVLMAPDEAYRQMARENPPFYAAPGFLD